jgi:hypothetical protein
MNVIIHQRCFNHAAREAAARCPQCQRYFCRECTTEHDEKVLCASCLEAAVPSREARMRRQPAFIRAAQFTVAFLILWFVFLGMGRSLLGLPDSFHSGELWQTNFLDED